MSEVKLSTAMPETNTIKHENPAHGSVASEGAGFDSSDDEYDDSDQAIISAAFDVWRANITQYMTKLEVEMISAQLSTDRQEGGGSSCSIPHSDREAFFVALRYGKTMQKTLVASCRNSDPVRWRHCCCGCACAI